METPSSTRRITRSLALHGSAQNEGTLNSQVSRSRSRGGNADRSALVDVTNDSPIVGVAAGSLKTPSSASAGKSKAWKGGRTPGSGEAILRGQVKNLLQKVEEEEVEVVKSTGEPWGAPFLALLGHLRSPASLLAPTPANTPQIGCLPVDKQESIQGNQSTKKDGESECSKAASNSRKEEEDQDLSECLLNRALLFDAPEESDSSFPMSELTSEESCWREASTEDDCSSVWSLQVHDGSSQKNEDDSDWVDDEEEDEDGAEEEEGADDDEDDDVDEDDSVLADLCEGIRMMSMSKSDLTEFAGKHIRFTYDSDDEIVSEEEVSAAVSSSILRLRGLPAPEGKHIRFQEKEDEE